MTTATAAESGRRKRGRPRKDGPDTFRADQAIISRGKSLKDRSVTIPDIADVRRRGRCRRSLRRFCETYNPQTFNLPWSADQLRAIERIEEAARLGALYAFAMPRGSGKSTIVRMATLWAISYGLCRYVFVIGANEKKAQDSLDAVKTFVRFLPLYAADFPEIAEPAANLAGIANRASGQIVKATGESTLIEWAKDRVVLATVPPPGNWPRCWPLRRDGMVPTSGSVVSASGLTGEGIRGSLLTLSTGESVRPDLVLLDDPQTPESARSPAQNVTREQLIAADVLGMAGPDRALSAVMPCTVIAPGDMVDRILDRKKHPLWRGERTRMLVTMPADLTLWQPYFDLYARDAQREPPDFAESTAYYHANREALERGAEASWPARKLPGEVSPVQSAMHLYFRDKTAFMAEYQNDPLPLVPDRPDDLKPDAIAARLNRCPREHVPPGCTRLTAFIDVQKDLLYFAVCGWTEGFGGAVLDYGAWPDQRRAYWALADANPTLSRATGIEEMRGALYAGLTALSLQLLGREWPVQDSAGSALRVERCLVDSGWEEDLVRKFCRQDAHAAVLLPSKGYGIAAAMVPMSDWPPKPGERKGRGWVLRPPQAGRGRLLLYDANLQKSFLAARLSQPLGSPGALLLFGDDAHAHRMLAEHCCAEQAIPTEGRGRKLEEWRVRPGRTENHLWDCCVGATVAASSLGLEAAGVPKPPPQQRQRSSYREQWQKAREGRR